VVTFSLSGYLIAFLVLAAIAMGTRMVKASARQSVVFSMFIIAMSVMSLIFYIISFSDSADYKVTVSYHHLIGFLGKGMLDLQVSRQGLLLLVFSLFSYGIISFKSRWLKLDESALERRWDAVFVVLTLSLFIKDLYLISLLWIVATIVIWLGGTETRKAKFICYVSLLADIMLMQSHMLLETMPASLGFIVTVAALLKTVVVLLLMQDEQSVRTKMAFLVVIIATPLFVDRPEIMSKVAETNVFFFFGFVAAIHFALGFLSKSRIQRKDPVYGSFFLLIAGLALVPSMTESYLWALVIMALFVAELHLFQIICRQQGSWLSKNHRIALSILLFVSFGLFPLAGFSVNHEVLIALTQSHWFAIISLVLIFSAFAFVFERLGETVWDSTEEKGPKQTINATAYVSLVAFALLAVNVVYFFGFAPFNASTESLFGSGFPRVISHEGSIVAQSKERFGLLFIVLEAIVYLFFFVLGLLIASKKRRLVKGVGSIVIFENLWAETIKKYEKAPKKAVAWLRNSWFFVHKKGVSNTHSVCQQIADVSLKVNKRLNEMTYRGYAATLVVCAILLFYLCVLRGFNG
jgi:hypothetical protein